MAQERDGGGVRGLGAGGRVWERVGGTDVGLAPPPRPSTLHSAPSPRTPSSSLNFVSLSPSAFLHFSISA